MINIQKMMQQAQQVQFKLQEMQEKFKAMTVEGEAGGGVVKVTLSCAGEMKALHIDTTLLNAGGKDMLEDLVMAAHNNANDAKEVRIKTETGKMMESMGLPKDQKLPI
jgi:DNA-binding YbaB/EbfC family protein